MNDEKPSVVFLSRPADSPDVLNAFAMGVRTTSGAVVSVRLERNK